MYKNNFKLLYSFENCSINIILLDTFINKKKKITRSYIGKLNVYLI